MKRKLIFHRISPFTSAGCPAVVICGISSRFQLLSPCESQIAHALLTRPPLTSRRHKNISLKYFCANYLFVRLACLKHAASVRPEPGSNSTVKLFPLSWLRFINRLHLTLDAFVFLNSITYIDLFLFIIPFHWNNSRKVVVWFVCTLFNCHCSCLCPICVSLIILHYSPSTCQLFF